ncbi:ERD (early-responsive to dehydration stress) family protein [Trifolium repens]|nr:ERD (early-responsive to dehydration stress) family protein [Trifolium repens]
MPCHSHTIRKTQFSQFPVPGNPFQQQMNPSHGTHFPTMMPGVQPNIFAQQAIYAPGFVCQNQMPFDSRPPFQQIQQPPIFQTQQQGFSPNELQQRPIFQAQQQGFPPAELQSERYVVYNANTLASIVAKKKNLQNWYVYYHNKYERDPSKRSTTRVSFSY